MEESNSTRLIWGIIGVLFTVFVVAFARYVVVGENPNGTKEDPVYKKFKKQKDKERRPMTVLPYEIVFPD